MYIVFLVGQCTMAYQNVDLIISFSNKFKDLLPCWQHKNDVVKYIMRHVRNGLIIHLTNSLKNSICEN